MTTGRTSSSGRFTLPQQGLSTGTWAAFYYADGARFYSETAGSRACPLTAAASGPLWPVRSPSSSCP